MIAMTGRQSLRLGDWPIFIPWGAETFGPLDLQIVEDPEHFLGPS